jgi:hypothetical protein
MPIASPVEDFGGAYFALTIRSVAEFGGPSDAYPVRLDAVIGVDGGHGFDTGVPELVQGLVDLIDGDPAWICTAVRTHAVTESMTATA